MKKLWFRLSIGAAMLVLSLMAMSLPFPDAHIPVALATGNDCSPDINVEMHGSTTVGPILVAAQAPFQALWPHTFLNNALNGSNGGIQDLDLSYPGHAAAGPAPGGFQSDAAMMSRPPAASAGDPTSHEPGVQATMDLIGPPGAVGSEQANNYFYNIANDAFVVAVSNDGSMNFLNAGLTVGDMTTIYGAGNATTGTLFPEGKGILHLHWDELPSVIARGITGSFPHNLIIPFSRATSGGSYTDWNKNIGVSDARVEETIAEAGTAHQFESADQAQAVVGNPNAISYTSLAQIPPVHDIKIVPMATVSGGPYIVASPTTVNDGTLPVALQRKLYIGTRDTTQVSRFDDGGNPHWMSQVRADDLMNFIRSPAGDALILAEGYPTIPAAVVPPIPDWDINLSGSVSLADLGRIVGHWGLTKACIGWIREDGNNDGKVSLGDIGTVTSHWGQDGLICDVAHKCIRDAAQKPQ